MSGIYSESSNNSFYPLNHLSSLPSAISADSSDFYQVVTEGKLKKFICNFPGCQKTFRFKSEIERHLSAHSGLRPHACKYPGCKKSFKRVDALDDHVRSQHTGEAPLTCPYPDCGQRFSTTAKLRYHTALHEDQKPYKCGVSGCERGFVTLSQLRQHEKSTLAHRRLGLTPDRKRSNLSQADQSPQGHYYNSEVEDHGNEMEDVKKRVKYDIVNPEAYENTYYAEQSVPKQIVHELPHVPHVPHVSHVPHIAHEPITSNHQLTYENIKLDEPPVEKREFLTNVLGENDILKKRLNYTESMIHVMKGQLDKVMMLLPNKFDHMKLLGYKQETGNPYFDGGNIPEGMMPEVDNFFF